MSIGVDGGTLIAFLLGLARAGAWLAVVPPFSIKGTIPMVVKVGFAAVLSFSALPSIATWPLPQTTPALIGAVVSQVLTGVVLGLVVRVLFSSFTATGSMADMFGGIILPPSIDPLTAEQVPILGQFYEQVAYVLLFVTGGELLIVHGFLLSFQSVGISLVSFPVLARVLTQDVVTFFLAALEMGAPLLIVLFATQVVLGMLAKAAPQMNVFWLGFPLQVMMALILVALSIRVLPSFVDRLVIRAVTDMIGIATGR